MNKKIIVYTFTGFVLGAVVVFLLVHFNPELSSDSGDGASKKPLYWVAPMDASYRRDKPGKSPMGMDLVPVYEEANSSNDSPGTVKIHPNIINNLSVETGKASQKTLIDRINTVGYITYDETTLTHIHSRTDGWVEALYVSHNGEYIEEGQPLYTLYSPTLVNAQQEYLLAKKRNSQSLMSAAKQRLHSLNFGAEELKKMIRSGKPLQNVTFYAESAGLIDNLNAREGVFLQPGTRLMTIGNLDKVWVEVELFERQLPYVEVGQSVEVTLDYLPSKVWSGKVDYIYPMVDSTNRTAKVRLEFENNEHELKPNMFADVSINTESDEQVLQVPHNAVIRTENNNRVVLALGDGKFKSVNVDLGRSTSDSIEILDGLVEGDEVVLSGQFLIDSESSIDSDFKRFADNGSDTDTGIGSSQITSMFPSARVVGVINAVDSESFTVNISRGAIKKWNREPMTMDFNVDTSLSIGDFNVGDNIDFTFEIRENGFFITEIHQRMMEHQHD